MCRRIASPTGYVAPSILRSAVLVLWSCTVLVSSAPHGLCGLGTAVGNLFLVHLDSGCMGPAAAAPNPAINSVNALTMVQGRAYAMRSSASGVRELVVYDVETGAVSTAGEFPNGMDTLRGLTVGATDAELFAVFGTNAEAEVIAFDPTTFNGTFTSKGLIGLGVTFVALAYDRASGVLYGWSNGYLHHLPVAAGDPPAARVATTTPLDVQWMEIVDGVLYAGRRNFIYEIDLGTAEVVRTTPLAESHDMRGMGIHATLQCCHLACAPPGCARRKSLLGDATIAVKGVDSALVFGDGPDIASELYLAPSGALQVNTAGGVEIEGGLKVNGEDLLARLDRLEALVASLHP